MKKVRTNWDLLLKEFERSGMKQTDFCKQKGIKKGTFSAVKSIRKKALQKRKSGQKPDGVLSIDSFVPVELSEDNAVIQAKMSFKVSNVEFKWNEFPDPQWFANVLKQLS